jgi:hypothetical protein
MAFRESPPIHAAARDAEQLAAESGEVEHLQVGPSAAKLRGQLVAVHLRHLDIGQQQSG